MAADEPPFKSTIDHQSPYESSLVGEHGELMGAVALMKLLHVANERTFRRIAAAGGLPVSVFHVPGRQGWFARTRDVAAWLDSVGNASASVAPSNRTGAG